MIDGLLGTVEIEEQKRIREEIERRWEMINDGGWKDLPKIKVISKKSKHNFITGEDK